MITKGRFKIKNNVTYRLFDKNGRPKKIFKPWGFIQKLIRLGVLSPRIPKIPLLLGMYVNQLKISNVVTNNGKAAVAGLINGVVTNFFEYIAIGTGTTAETASDTALENEITTGGGARTAGTTSRVTTDTTNDTAQIEVTFNFTASFSVTESGVFDSASAGTMLARQTFASIGVDNGDQLTITWQFDVD